MARRGTWVCWPPPAASESSGLTGERHQPLYTPEPDVVHELVGHAPLLIDSRFAEVNSLFGVATQRVLFLAPSVDQALDALAAWLPRSDV